MHLGLSRGHGETHKVTVPGGHIVVHLVVDQVFDGIDRNIEAFCDCDKGTPQIVQAEGDPGTFGNLVHLFSGFDQVTVFPGARKDKEGLRVCCPRLQQVNDEVGEGQGQGFMVFRVLNAQRSIPEINRRPCEG